MRPLDVADLQTNISDLYEEQGRQLVELQDQQSSNETYVNEFRARLAKLTERNTASEVSVITLWHGRH